MSMKSTCAISRRLAFCSSAMKGDCTGWAHPSLAYSLPRAMGRTHFLERTGPGWMRSRACQPIQGGRHSPDTFTAPPLTSVRVSIAELGAAAAERVLHGVRQGNAHKRLHSTLPTTLVVRESTGSAPAERKKDRSKGTRGRRKDA